MVSVSGSRGHALYTNRAREESALFLYTSLRSETSRAPKAHLANRTAS